MGTDAEVSERWDSTSSPADTGCHITRTPTFESRDVSELVIGLSHRAGTFNEYEISEGGTLRRRMRVMVWRVDSSRPDGGYFETIHEWWQNVQNAHGRMRMYAEEGILGAVDHRRIEFRVSFRQGRVASQRAEGDDTTSWKKSLAASHCGGAMRLKKSSAACCTGSGKRPSSCNRAR